MWLRMLWGSYRRWCGGFEATVLRAVEGWFGRRKVPWFVVALRVRRWP